MILVVVLEVDLYENISSADQIRWRGDSFHAEILSVVSVLRGMCDEGVCSETDRKQADHPPRRRARRLSCVGALARNQNLHHVASFSVHLPATSVASGVR